MKPQSHPNARQRLHELFEPYRGGPAQPTASLYVDFTIVVAILTSCAVVIVEHSTDPTAFPTLHVGLRVAEAAFTLAFSLEYILRWYASPSRVRYPFTLFACVDLMAIAPSLLVFLHAATGGASFLMLRAVRVLRILRLLRLLRLLKVFRHGYAIYQILNVTRIWLSAIVFHYRLGRLVRLVALMVLAWAVGTNLLYVTETTFAPADSDSPYASGYWANYWRVLIFLISGMDAEAPISAAGRAEVTFLLLSGIVFVAVFTGEVVSILVRTAHRLGKMALKPPQLRLTEHIAILGRNRHLDNIIAQVQMAVEGRHYVLVVCADADELPTPAPETRSRVFALAGDPSRDDVLDQANLEEAQRVIVLSGDVADGAAQQRDNVALMHALACLGRTRRAPLVVQLQDPESLRYAASIDSADCLVGQQFGEKLVSQAVLHAGVSDVYDELMTFTGETNEFYRVPVPPSLAGMQFRQAQEELLDLDDEPMVLVGLDDGQQPYREFHLAVGAAGGDGALGDRVLTQQDNLIVIARRRPSWDTGKLEAGWQGSRLARG